MRLDDVIDELDKVNIGVYIYRRDEGRYLESGWLRVIGLLVSATNEPYYVARFI
jgi:hypothetical protein